MNLNLEYYKIFYYIGKYKNITLAAEKLSLSQPAVSQSIRNLERELGVSLFVRTPKGVKLTAEGEVLYPYVIRGYEALQKGEQKLMERINMESGEISIGASDMTLQFYLLDYLERFHEKYPDIKVHVTNAPTPETLRYLQEGRIDFGVITAPVPEKSHIKLKKVRDVQDVFVAGEKYKAYRDRIVTFEELKDLPLICLEGETSTGAYVTEFLKKHGTVLSPEFELATSDMLVQFARRGLGMASVVRDFAQRELEEGKLFEIRLEEEIPGRAMCVVTDDRASISVASRCLLELLEPWEKESI